MSNVTIPYLSDLSTWLSVSHRPKQVTALVQEQDPVHLLTLYTSLHLLFYDLENLTMYAESKGRMKQRTKWQKEQDKVVAFLVPMQQRLESLLSSIQPGGDPFADDIRGRGHDDSAGK